MGPVRPAAAARPRPSTPRAAAHAANVDPSASKPAAPPAAPPRTRSRAAKGVPAPRFLPLVSKEAAARVRLVNFSDLWQDAPWLKDNDFLRTGHRCKSEPCTCLVSVCCIHSETGNIWSHLLATLLAIGIALRVLLVDLRGSAWEHYLNLGSFLLSGVGVFLCSTIFHTFMPVSARTFAILSKVDYLGIGLHLFGANLPAVNYEFYCEPGLRRFYVGLFLLASTAIAVAASIDGFGRPQHRWARAAVFLTCGAGFIAPYIHKIVAFGTGHEETDRALPWYLLSAVIYAVGTVIFSMRFPERLWPGRFDRWAHSHQIFHVLCVPAYLAFFVGVYRAWEWRATTECTHAFPEGLLHGIFV